MWSILYTCLIFVAQPFVLLFIFLKSLKAPCYRKRIGERYACYSRAVRFPVTKGVLIHAASVGELIAAIPLIRRIQTCYPDLPVTVTTVTPTGSERVIDIFGDQVHHVYLPYDLPFVLTKFIRDFKPMLCIVIETEIWPNLISALHRHHIPYVIANARLSARSSRRYALVRDFVGSVMKKITMIFPQDQISYTRYLQLGCREDQLYCTGNLKFDFTISENLQKKIRTFHQHYSKNRPIWIAASTHEGEESLVLEAHRKLLAKFPDLLLILVPRHPERFDGVATMIQQQEFSFIRRSRHVAPSDDTQVLLGDTMGELMLMYSLSDVAFIGGSLIPQGGHNPLEAIAFGIPVITGCYTFNFSEIFQQLIEHQGALKIRPNSETLTNAVEIFLTSPALCQKFAHAGQHILQKNKGALDNLMNRLSPYFEAFYKKKGNSL